MSQDYKNLLKNFVERRFFRDPKNIIQPHAQRIDDLNNRLFRGINQWVVLQGQRLSGKIHQLIYLTPAKNILQLEEKIAILHHRLTQNINSTIRFDIKRLDGALKNLNALSPLAILGRGYSITSFRGNALTKSDQLKQGDTINTQLSSGHLKCTVDKITSPKIENP